MLLGRTPVALAVGVVCRRARLAALTVLLVVGLGASPAGAATFTVNTTADNINGICDSSHCSLREALLAAAANSEADTIQFNVPGLSGGVASIVLGSALPDVPQSVTINGFTQPGALANGIGAPANIAATMKVEIVATGLATGLRLVQGSVIQGLVIRGATTLVEMAGGGTVRGCYLGTTASGLAAGGGTQVTAIRVDSSGDVRTFTIGGTTAAERNVIAGPGTPTSVGIDIVGTPRLTVEGNLIGVASNASSVLGHGLAGVRYQSLSSLASTDITVTGNVIGGAAAADGAGIRIEPCTSGVCSPGQVFEVFKNYIGVNGSLVAIPNRRGIFVGDPVSVNTYVGRVLNQNGNTISGNLGAGVAVAPGSQDFSASVRVEGNSITNNGGLGIDLFDDGVVTADAGARRLGQQNLPVITSIARGPLTTTVAGTVTGIPNQFVRVDAYRSTAVDPTGYGEGEVYVGSTSTTFSPTGQATFVITVPSVVSPAEAITATSTTFVTSEFSRVAANLGLTLSSGTTLETYQLTNQTVRVTNPSTSSGPAAPVVFSVNLSDGVLDKVSCSPGVTAVTQQSVLTITAPQVLPGGTAHCDYTFRFPTVGVRTVAARIVSSGTFDPDAQNDRATSVFDVNRVRQISLSGRISTPPGNPPLPATTITVAGPVNVQLTPDSRGRFELLNVPAGTYTIDASAPSWVFSPGYQLLNQTESRSDLDFSAKAVFSVSGRAIDQSGAALANIDIYLSGSETARRTTGPDGRYDFGPLDYTGTYSLRASSNDSGSTFLPRRAQFSAVIGPQLLDFVLTPNSTTFVVNTTSDVGDGSCDATHCSLRDALAAASANNVPDFRTFDRIHFAIPGSGVRTIVLTAPLPVATFVDISGYTQPGSAPGTRDTGAIDALPLIEIDGNGQTIGLVLDSSTATGLIVNRAETLVRITGGGGALYGSFLGTTADGLRSAGGNQRVAVDIASPTNEVVVGGAAGNVRNVIAGDGGLADIGVDVSGQDEYDIVGNLIGLGKDGVTVLGHGAAGIRYRTPMPSFGAAFGIGTPGPGGNVIAGATAPDGAGIVIGACPSPCPLSGMVYIQGNVIGATADGTSPAPNTYGIRIEDPVSARVAIGQSTAPTANTIRFNTRAGILIAPPTTATSSAVLVGANRISDNGELGLDVDGDGPTANDAGDVDFGRQNWPRITVVRRDAGSTTIEGVATGEPGGRLTLQFYANTLADPSGHGEGERWLGAHPVTLDGTGTTPFSVTFPAIVSTAEQVSALAVGATTSEFSRAETALTPIIGAPPSGFTYVAARFPVGLAVSPTAPSGATGAFIDVALPPDGRPTATCTTPQVVVTPTASGVRITTPRVAVGGSLDCTLDVVFTTPGVKRLDFGFGSATPAVAQVPTIVASLRIAHTLVTLGGRVTEAGTAPSVPVTVTLSGTTTSSVQVAADGSYGFADVPAGTYTITPQAAGRAFAPATRTLVDQAVSRTDLDFAMSLPLSITGRVTERGAPAPGVTVALTGDATGSTITDATGAYTFAGLAAGSYTVAVSQAGRAFAPPSRTLSNITGNTTADFERVALLSITGRVTDLDGGSAVPGVTVTLAGGTTATTVTDASGAYAFASLSPGTYTVAVSQDGRLFDPPSRTLAALTADATADFTRRPLYTISGTITDLNGSPVPGVIVGLSGGRTETATTDADGFYVFANLPSTSFTVTPTRDGFTFSPIPRSITRLENNEDVSFVVQSGRFARFLAEGATGPLFDTQIALFNATGTPATATLTFQKPDGTTLVETVPLAGVERRTVIPETLAGLENSAFSTVIASDQPIAVDRTMTWDDSRYGSHAETGIVQPLTRWFLAEGATTAGFELFYLVQNANPTPATVQVRYLLTSGAPLTKTYVVQPNSRFNIWVNLEDALLADAEVSADVTSDVPIIVERAMYRTVNGQDFGMGHEGAGVPRASTQWYFAEGATGSFFDLFFLIANPTDDVAQVEATYLKPDGSTVVKTYTVQPNSRFNIWVDLEDPALASTAVGTTFRVTNGVAVVVERAMWWAGDFSQWVEGHNTAGATQTGEKWALAEGEVSGAPFFTDTFILVANTGATAGTVRVTLVFEDGTAPISKDLPIPASARLNVMVSAEFPEAVGKRFGTIVESVGPTRLPLVVERAMYNRSGGVDFAAGTAALGARLR